MLHFKKYLSAAVEEQEIMRLHGDKVDHAILSKMEVLYQFIKEALRLHHTDAPKGFIVATSPALYIRIQIHI